MSKPLVKYAGYEDPRAKTARNATERAHLETRIETAARMFSEGRDTLDISQQFHCSEARILEWLTVARSKRLGLPDPYGFRR